MLGFVLSVVANAFGRRFAGGLLSQWLGPIGGTQVARSTQAAIAGLCAGLLSESFSLGCTVALGTFLGATAGFPGGMLPKAPWSWGILAHGIMATAPIAVAIWAWTYLQDFEFPLGVILALLIAGLLRGPAYWVAQKWTPHYPQLGLINLRRQSGPIDPPPFAEFLSGASLGAALYTLVWSL